MERSDHPRVVVIGAGIVGSAIAMHLAERNLRPLLVDVDRAGHGASARSFASLSAFGTDPVGYYELACTALASWSGWAERLGEVGFRRGGGLRWEANPTEGRQLAEQVERARSQGYPIVPVGESELRRRPGAAAGRHGPGRRGRVGRGRPRLGQLVADEIATGNEAWLLASFRPGRFAERATRVMLDIEEMFR